MLPLLRQRRQAGSCRTSSDCNQWNPCCSQNGYCGTAESGHCDGGYGYGNGMAIRGGTNQGVVHPPVRGQYRPYG